MVVLFVLSLLAQAGLLWLSCKLCFARMRPPAGTTEPAGPVRYRRALLVVLGIGLTNLVILAAIVWWLPQALGESLSGLGSLPPLLIEVLGWIPGLVITFLWIWLGLRLTFGKAVLVELLSTVLSLGLALGLVFAVKTTLFEAYIVPTGGLAETVLGYHLEPSCPACGYPFAVNASMEAADPTLGRPPLRVTQCLCPNCRREIVLDRNQPGLGLVSGDRLLITRGVLNWLSIPSRFDLLVFRYPLPFPGSAKPINYVKRLVGLPGETIAICDGKLYVLPPDKGPRYNDPPEPVPPMDADPFGMDPPRAGRMHPNDERVVELFRKGQFQILRRPPDTIVAMKRLVYDNDHPARDLKELPRWADKEAKWAADGTGFRLAGDDTHHWLRYHHLLRENLGNPQLITDFMGYNTANLHPPPESKDGDLIRPGENWVGDLILECEVVIDKAEGELALELSRGVDRFQARFDLGTDFCTLHRNNEEIGPGGRKISLTKGTHPVRFANVEQRLLVWVDDNVVFDKDEVTYKAPATPGPSANDLEPASIAARKASVAVKHLRLWRDTYYTITRPDSPQRYEPGDLPPIPDRPVVPGADQLDRGRQESRWKELHNPQVQTMYVQPGSYLVLGDNSPHSADSRNWGLVPADHLLGRATLVYYPFSRMGRVR
jgi:signal peptidase I